MKHKKKVVKCEFIGKFWPEWAQQSGTSDNKERISNSSYYPAPNVFRITLSNGDVRERIQFDGRSLT